MVRLMASFCGQFTGFSPGRLYRGGGTSAGGQSINGGTHKEGHKPYGGPNFDRLYHKLKAVIVKLQLHDAVYQLPFY